MNVLETKLPGVLVFEPRVFGDERGFFMETWHAERYEEVGLPSTFVQDNLSFSQRGVLRGLHFQNPDQQGKLVYVLQGEVYDVAVDIRAGSPTFGEWAGATLSSENKRQLYVPEGFAHGFLVLSERAEFLYKCSDFYAPQHARGIAWDDARIAIGWPATPTPPVLSANDRANPRLSAVADNHLPSFDG